MVQFLEEMKLDLAKSNYEHKENLIAQNMFSRVKESENYDTATLMSLALPLTKLEVVFSSQKMQHLYK